MRWLPLTQRLVRLDRSYNGQCSGGKSSGQDEDLLIAKSPIRQRTLCSQPYFVMLISTCTTSWACYFSHISAPMTEIPSRVESPSLTQDLPALLFSLGSSSSPVLPSLKGIKANMNESNIAQPQMIYVKQEPRRGRSSTAWPQFAFTHQESMLGDLLLRMVYRTLLLQILREVYICFRLFFSSPHPFWQGLSIPLTVVWGPELWEINLSYPIASPSSSNTATFLSLAISCNFRRLFLNTFCLQSNRFH